MITKHETIAVYNDYWSCHRFLKDILILVLNAIEMISFKLSPVTNTNKLIL